MTAFRRALDRTLAGTICVLMVAMVLNVLWQVFSRFVLSTPSSFTEELARYLMVWLGLLGGAYGVGTRSHLAVDYVVAGLSGSRRRWAAAFIECAVIVFAAGVMVGGGVRLVWITLTLGQTSAALDVPLGYVYLAVPLAGVGIVVYGVLHLLELHRGRDEESHPSGGLN
jgi:TRAP-type C4-dicarboxylate transport system permease small subunit